jgi:GR25 family glycosyltransferase involved in LPS biosynthesis
MTLVDYFDRTCIINLPDRDDRLRAIRKELHRCGGDDHPEKVQIPYAPKPDDASDFDSRGVYGSYLSHYNILKDALRNGIQTVWVLEDDATFSHRMMRDQARIVKFLQRNPWDMCFFGHSLHRELRGMPKGLIHYTSSFRWAHCYAVHSRVLPRLIAYLDENMTNPQGHPRGGRMYIDPAYSFFRRLNPDVISLVANPAMSVQRGSVSSLAGGHWYDRSRLFIPLVGITRSARDELWRWTGLHLTTYPEN